MLQESGPGFTHIMAGMKWLKGHKVMVGIPQENSGRAGSVTNVELAYIHSQGSPRMHIPPRPFIEPAIADPAVQERIAREIGSAVTAALDGDFASALAGLHRAGFVGENAIKVYMGSGALAPNAPITVSGGWMRNPVSGKPVHIKGKGSAAPLIDTGELRKAVTHVIDGE